MSIKHAIWKVGENPAPLAEASLGKEALLERMIVKDPAILSERWMLIGQQVRTDHGGIIDLLALNQDGQIILIELKRDATPREVVAQALDYASWVQELAPEQVAAIYEKFSNGASLGAKFEQTFGLPLDEEQLNGSHQIVIVASILDASTERIVNYLSGMNVAINVIFFQVFQDGDRQYLSRAWLIDPVETEIKAGGSTVGPKEEWNGQYYVSFGHGTARNWADAQKYGFISAGYGAWYTQTLFMLSEGDRVWVNIPKCGFVGVGRVTGPSVPLRDFSVQVDGVERPFLDVATADYGRANIDNDDQCEYFVPVQWIATRNTNEAFSEVGFFGNQNTVCRPRDTKWDHTVKRLKTLFGVSEA